MSNLSSFSFLPAKLVNFIRTQDVPAMFDDDNAMFYYQDLTHTRLPSMLMMQYENMNQAEKSDALRQRFMLQWFIRLAHEKSYGVDFRNLYAMYVFRDTMLGRAAMEKTRLMMCDDHIMPNNDTIQGVLWIQLKEDRGKLSEELRKYLGESNKKNKRPRTGNGNAHHRPRDGDDDDDDDGENLAGAMRNQASTIEEEADQQNQLTAAARVCAFSALQMKILNGGVRGIPGKTSTVEAIQLLAMGTPVDGQGYNLKGEGDFSILVGIPTAISTVLAKDSNEVINADAWYEPERFFKLSDIQFPEGSIIPPGTYCGNHVKYLPNIFNLWSVNVKYFWLNGKNPGNIMFRTALFPAVVKHDDQDAVPLTVKTFNLHDPYAVSRPNKYNLMPPAMDNVKVGFTQEKMKLMQQPHAGFLLEDIQMMIREYLENQYKLGELDPVLFDENGEERMAEMTANELEEVKQKMKNIEKRQAVIRTNTREFIRVYGEKRKLLVLNGLVKVSDALTPIKNAPLSYSSYSLGTVLEQYKTKVNANRKMLDTMWSFPPNRFVNLSLYQHSFVYMLEAMSLFHMFSLHTMAPLFYLAVASMPWERAKNMMPLHLLMVGRPSLGKSFFMDTIKDLAFDQITVTMTAFSTKFFAAKPPSGCFEGNLSGRALTISELHTEMFDPNAPNSEQKNYIKTMLTEAEMGVTRLEKDIDTGLLAQSEFTIGNWCAMIAAANAPIKDAAIVDRIVTIAPPERIRSDGRTARQLKQSILTQDAATKEQVKNMYQLVSATLGYVQHAINAGVLDTINPISMVIQESIYEEQVVKHGGMRNPSRTSNVLQRISAHAAMQGAVNAVFRGNASFVPKEIRLPNNAECILHVEALSAVPADLDQTLHFTALQTKNFNPLVRMALQMLSKCIFGFEKLDKYDVDSLKFVNNNQPGQGKKLIFAKHPEQFMSPTDSPDDLFNNHNWAFIPAGSYFGRTIYSDVDVTPATDFYKASAVGVDIANDIKKLADQVFTFLNDNKDKHSFNTDLQLTRRIFLNLCQSDSAAKQFIRFHYVGTQKERCQYFIFDADEMVRCLDLDVMQSIVKKSRNAATPYGTMLLTSPQLASSRMSFETYHVDRPEYTRIPWHEDDDKDPCYLFSTPELKEKTIQICEEGMRSRAPLRSTYNAHFWKKRGCTCFRSHILKVHNEEFIDKQRAVPMRLTEQQRRATSKSYRKLKFPVEITQFYIKMVTLGYDPFDITVQDRYHPMYNTKTWYADDGIYAFTESDNPNYPEDSQN